MPMRLKIAGAIALAGLLVATAAASMGHGSRVDKMKEIGKNLGAIGKVAKGEMAYSPAIIANAEALVHLSKDVEKLFPEGSGGPDTRAKPEIWQKWSEFVAASQDFEDATPGLVTATKSGDVGQIKAAVGAVGKTCGGCHKPFRAPKKK